MFAEFRQQGALAPYIQLANYTRSLIIQGTALPGTRLPSVRVTAKESGVSTATVDRAWAVLKREGLLRGVQGVGVEVADLIASQYGHTGPASSSRIVHDGQPVRTSDIPAWVCARLDGADVIRRFHWIESGGVCLQHDFIWFAPDLAAVVPELDFAGALHGPWQEMYSDRTGVTVHSKVVHCARLADDVDRDRFELAETAAVLVARREYSVDGGIKVCGETSYRPGTDVPAY
ncbi:GntR family transcriptional regulator [Glycomyces sp. YM15]|uniref:GntR family transcriptional regulator n=1 Tax=Glycomyces sp. YM15 TaxID=2800446 RepID=UPI0019664348|nr:GntR family transcriptional regulator [Glycomyces sp. YM15]